MAKKKVFQISNALTEGLEETITAAHNYSGELRVEIIPIKKIEVDPENPRDLILTLQDAFNGINENDQFRTQKIEEWDRLQTIANSIRDQGIINPIVVYKFGDKYRLVAGERRTLASILAGKTDIQAKILESKPSDLKISLLQWIENVERSDLSLWERLKNLEKIVAVYTAKKQIPYQQISITELSNLISCSKPHAINYKAVLLSNENLKQLIRENKIRNLEKAALIASVDSSIYQSQLITACVMGASLKKLRSMLEQQQRQNSKSIKSNKHIERRGRQSTTINLGETKSLKVAKIIIETLSEAKTLTNILSNHFNNIDWNDYKAINNAFKELLKQLEELHA